MYQRARMIRNACVAAAVLVAAVAVRAQAAPLPPVDACRDAIIKNSAAFQRSKLSKLQACYSKLQKGKLPKSTPTLDTCLAKARKGIDGKALSLQKAIAKACCGATKACLNTCKKNPGMRCTSNADCAYNDVCVTVDSDDLSVSDIFWDNRAKVCSQGSRAGIPCTANTDCPGNCFGGAPPAGVGAECSSSSTCGGGSCNNIGTCALPGAGPDYCPNLESGKLANYTNPQGFDATLVCVGGTKHGKACTSDAKCGGGTCTGNGSTMGTLACGTCRFGSSDGESCRADEDCGAACEGGPDDGTSCAVAADCSQFCFNGASSGTACQQKCKGGSNDGTICITGAQCTGGGVCNGEFDCGRSCQTGPFTGNACTTGTAATDCHGVCNAASSNPGADCTANPGCPGGACTLFPCAVTVCATSSCRAGSCNPGLKLAGPEDVASCVLCAGEAGVDQIVKTGSAAQSPVAATDLATDTCKAALSDELNKFFSAKTKLLTACQRSVIKGKIAGPCPTGPVTDKKSTLGKIKAAQDKMIAKITDPTKGKCLTVTPAAIGAPVRCPAITPPGGSSCAGPITTTADLVNCLACVTEFKADCAFSLAATLSSGTNELPAECNPTCGNGKIDPGETCDDGNVVDGDACPSDCTISPCTGPFTDVIGTVTFTPPTGVTSVGSLHLYIEYPDAKVRIPGQGNDATVVEQLDQLSNDVQFFPQDYNYSLDLVVAANDPVGTPISSPVVAVTFQKCTSAPSAPVDGDFRCLLRDGSDSSSQAFYGGTCTVDVP